MIQVADRLVDYKKLKSIFSNNKEIMEQVMMGLMLAVHDKAPALKRHYNNKDWDRLEETAKFLETTYKYVASAELLEVIDKLMLQVGKREDSDELNETIANIAHMANYIIKDIEYYLSEL